MAELSALDSAQVAVLTRLLEVVLPYPELAGGPTAADTVAYVQRRLAREDRALAVPLAQLLTRVTGDEAGWLAAAAQATDGTDATLFQALRGWAWDGFLADPRWGVNRGGRGWEHVGFAGRPRSRERS